jgi:hypothetical protein
MSKSFAIGHPWSGQGWKVKIRDNERSEPPHATVIKGVESWRFGLRTGTFLDKEPPPRRVPNGLVGWLEEHIDELRSEWDCTYPENPVGST